MSSKYDVALERSKNRRQSAVWLAPEKFARHVNQVLADYVAPVIPKNNHPVGRHKKAEKDAPRPVPVVVNKRLVYTGIVTDENRTRSRVIIFVDGAQITIQYAQAELLRELIVARLTNDGWIHKHSLGVNAVKYMYRLTLQIGVKNLIENNRHCMYRLNVKPEDIELQA